MRKLRTWREVLIEQLAADWEAAIDYLQVTVEDYQVDGDTPLFMLGLWTFVESQGGIAEVAKKTGIAPESLSEILSSDDPPRIDTLGTLLNAFGWRVSIEPIAPIESCPKRQNREVSELNTGVEQQEARLAESSSS